jgi:hypothetical protein
MSEEVVWSEDYCTCGHAHSKHTDAGWCLVCSINRLKGQGSSCPRYQWNGVERKRIW